MLNPQLFGSELWMSLDRKQVPYPTIMPLSLEAILVFSPLVTKPHLLASASMPQGLFFGEAGIIGS